MANNEPLAPSDNNDNASRYFQSEYGHFIDGQWEASSSGKTILMENPATRQVISKIQAGNAADAARAVEAAGRAFPTWSRTSRSERQRIIYEMARRLRNRLPEYAMMETLDNGKPITEAKTFDLPLAIEQFEIFSGAPWYLQGQTIDTKDAFGTVIREPLGVCAQIIPWNVPLIMMAAKIAPALAAGNTIVLKPAETVCLAILEFFREMQDLLPPGVANVVTGYGSDLGEALVTHPQVRKIAFTGSRPTARTLMRYASANIIPQTMELGGKSANIVCEDADLDAAAEGAAMSTILNKGEVCLAGSRVFVQESIREQFLDKFQSILRSVQAGDPTSASTQLGPQASKAQMDKILAYFDIANAEGATALLGGKKANPEGFENGLFIEPTIFVDVDNKMRISQEEIFGPVTNVISWKDEDEVIRLANDSEYGLGGGLWTTNLARAYRIARAMETGTIWVNRYYNFLGGMPIGGYKQSGFGREFANEVLNHYTLTKSVIVNLDEGPMGIFN